MSRIANPKGKDGLPVMSRSGLEAVTCPSRYNRVYNEGMDDSSDYSRRGTAYHLVLATYHRRLMAAQVSMDAEEANLAFTEGIAASGCPPQLIPEVRELFDREVQHYELPIDKVVDIESRAVREDAKLPYQFRPDLVLAWDETSTLEVKDHKTFYVAMTEVQARNLFQTRYNAWAAMQEFPGFAVYRMSYRFPRLNKEVFVDFYPADKDELEREVAAHEATRREWHAKNEWPEIPGDQCAFCHLKCSVLDDDRRALVRVRNEAEFQSAAGMLLSLEQKVKVVKKAIRGYSVANGSVDVKGETFGFFPVSPSDLYLVAQVVDAIREGGEEPSFQISASALKAETKRLPWLWETLKGLTKEVKERSARFSHKSLKATLKEAQPYGTEADGEGEGDGDDAS